MEKTYSLILATCLTAKSYTHGNQQIEYNLLQTMEKAVAKAKYCSRQKPCNVTISKNDAGYVAIVLQAVSITEEGALKYLPSKTYYQLDHEGIIQSANPTP